MTRDPLDRREDAERAAGCAATIPAAPRTKESVRDTLADGKLKACNVAREEALVT